MRLFVFCLLTTSVFGQDVFSIHGTLTVEDHTGELISIAEGFECDERLNEEIEFFYFSDRRQDRYGFLSSNRVQHTLNSQDSWIFSNGFTNGGHATFTIRSLQNSVLESSSARRSGNQFVRRHYGSLVGLDERCSLIVSGELIENDVFHGDVNFDFQFDSSDVVQLFISGQYEDNLPLNSRWGDGDFNGDLEFDSNDLVQVFRTGQYVENLLSLVNVPENNGVRQIALLIGILAISIKKRQKIQK